jgi:gamma-glutamylcyclotransferase (GGCT)/AIG2-like uncharacterized protein YtfP
MKNLILLFTLFVSLASLKTKEELFTGKILYKYSFTDLQGNDINNKLVPYLGSEQHYFIDGKNYKSYNQNKLQQLYSSETNKYYFFSGTNSAQKIDGSKPTSQKFNVTKLDRIEKVAGYDCKAVQIETDEATTIYYYSPQVKTDKNAFAKHRFGEWNKYLAATDGALALKYIMTNKKYGYVWTSKAIEISKMELSAKDFALPENVQVNQH